METQKNTSIKPSTIKNTTLNRDRQTVLRTAKSIFRSGLVSATSGNVSMRMPTPEQAGSMAITPSSISYESMTLGQIVIVDFHGEPIWGNSVPSSESLMHGAIYAARPDVNAIIHTHSIYATSLAVAGLAIPALMDEMVIYLGDSIQVANYGFPSSEELANGVVEALGERNAVLMKNHGVVVVGNTMPEALHLCHLVEHLAHIYFNVKSLGIDSSLDPNVLDTELTLFKMRQKMKLSGGNSTVKQ